MKKSPVISVIIPVHNEERYIGRAIRSVLNQNMAAELYEIIVVNDGSTDRTQYAIDLFGDEVRGIYSTECKGLPYSLNVAIKAARGRFIVRVDGDDYVSSDYLYMLSRFLDENPHWDAAACDYLLVDDAENVLERRNCMEHPIGCATMFRLDRLIDIGLYDDSFLMHEDRDLRIRFLKKYSIHRIELPLYRYRRHDMNMTNNGEDWKVFEEKLYMKHVGVDG